jgi:hypothetical protein
MYGEIGGLQYVVMKATVRREVLNRNLPLAFFFYKATKSFSFTSKFSIHLPWLPTVNTE